MSPETRAFLDRVRDAEDPTAEDEARVLARVRSAAAAGALAGVVAGAVKSSKLFGLPGTAAFKLGGAVVGLTAGVWLASSAFAPEPLPLEPPVSRAAVPPSARLPSVAPSVPVPRVEPSVSPVLPVTPVPRPRSAGTPEVSPAGPASLRQEIALLGEVQRALDQGDASLALALLDRHVTADRQLAAERLAARVHALCALGRTGEARRAAETLARVHPASVQRSAVERSCAGQPVPER